MSVAHNTQAWPRELEQFVIPLGRGHFGYIYLPHPMTEREWVRLRAVLDSFEPGMVLRDPAASEDSR